MYWGFCFGGVMVLFCGAVLPKIYWSAEIKLYLKNDSLRII